MIEDPGDFSTPLFRAQLEIVALSQDEMA